MQITLRVEVHLRQYYQHLGKPTSYVLDGTPTVADFWRAAGVSAELPGSVLCNRPRVEKSEVVPDGAESIVLQPMQAARLFAFPGWWRGVPTWECLAFV